MKNFTTRTFGKWILAGEHSVLRGGPALVFPLASRCLELQYTEGAESLTLEMAGERGDELQLLFWSVLEKACALKNIKRTNLFGNLRLVSNLPVGSGLGASAAFCGAMARWFESLNYVAADEVAEFSRQLENLFHGESSGVDIAVALSGKPLLFTRGTPAQSFDLTWKPPCYVSYSGKRGVTVDCVNKVKEVLNASPSVGAQIDRNMLKAVGICMEALRSPVERLSLLAEGIQLAATCFHEWGLTEGPVENHMEWLQTQGALAAKPTGSGGGGYVLSLWSGKPSDEALEKLIPCF